ELQPVQDSADGEPGDPRRARREGVTIESLSDVGEGGRAKARSGGEPHPGPPRRRGGSACGPASIEQRGEAVARFAREPAESDAACNCFATRPRSMAAATS